mgnify:CR=1 FL=1
MYQGITVHGQMFVCGASSFIVSNLFQYNAYVEVEGAESEPEELPEGTEREIVEQETTDSIAKILGSPKKVPVTTKCVLELDKDKKPLIEMNRTLVRKLKPHQVEGEFLWY